MSKKCVLINPEKGIKIKLAGEFLRVGRSEDNEIVLKDPSVSRHHLNIYIKDDGIIIEDAGSRTGFFVNGKARRMPTRLNEGDSLQIGEQRFLLRESGSPQREAQPKNTRKDSINTDELNEDSTDEAAQKRKRLILVAAVVLVFAGVMLQEDPKKQVPQVQDLSVDTDRLEESFKNIQRDPSDVRHKSLSEIEAEGKFHEGLREYHNGNFVRAIKHFNDALTQSPSMDKAQDYLQYSNTRLLNKVNNLMRDGQRSFSLLQFQRSKAQFGQVLTILSEQIPGYWQREAQKIMNRKSDVRAPAQEESLLNIPCDKTRLEAKCKLAVELIKQARIKLGEENSIR